ncbi:MAG: sugar transferase [Candidatus Azobacteroides sp.]|nr:sugar transferase [Candidatus Azobacteroides sp.]
MYKIFFKRLMDIVFSSIFLILFFPLFLVLIIIITLDIQENPFFYQKRPGKKEKIFRIVKFKTMKEIYDEKGLLLPDKDRLTTTGKILRKYSIDELPELYNILKGEMSFVGPRPLLPEYLPFYSKTEKIRHSVRPGLTGLAQISGRNKLDWNQRLALDVKYVKNISFISDLYIIGKTILQVLNSKDVSIDPNEYETYLNKEREEKTKL